MEVEARRDAIGRFAVVAAPVVQIARMQRHVDVAGEVDHEGERLQAHIGGQALVGDVEEPEEEAVPYEPDFSKKPVFANGLPYQNLNMDCGDEKVYFYKKFSLD